MYGSLLSYNNNLIIIYILPIIISTVSDKKTFVFQYNKNMLRTIYLPVNNNIRQDSYVIPSQKRLQISKIL